VSSTITALYDTREEAERALRSLQAELSMTQAGIFDQSPAARDALRALDLTPEERAACESKLADGEYLLLAQVGSGEDPDRVVEILERPPADALAPIATEPYAADTGAEAHGARTTAEERLPIVEEELRIGTRDVVRGGAKVQSRVESVPVLQDVELIEEFTRVERRPVSRLATEEELERGGLLRGRVIEISQVREEAVVSKDVFVREEVVVSKTVEHRVEQIHETLRRTEVEVEALGAEPAPNDVRLSNEAGDERSER
jgi:stress response protein YsnF